MGVLYLTLTELIDSALLAAGPWAGKALSYLVKLSPIIWWAMPVSALTPPSPAGAPRYSWYPDTSKCLFETGASWSTTQVSSQTKAQPTAKTFWCRNHQSFPIAESLQSLAIQLSNLYQKPAITAYIDVTDPGLSSPSYHYPALDSYCHYLPVTKLQGALTPGRRFMVKLFVVIPPTSHDFNALFLSCS
ncbi:hypothetical protein DSO57_1018103 [Entomophthora muscae]|uniref:Uncharacterized protein n=1 Tax=Entomophthora muscae TaxID=34485 RepID=A0ACC2TS15_9FUNG|nr:hypothetical protein DSO57_1018103 [Entomophthora muscae]